MLYYMNVAEKKTTIDLEVKLMLNYYLDLYEKKVRFSPLIRL